MQLGLPWLRRGVRVHSDVVSPSKRAGDTVDESVDDRQHSANGNGSGHGASESAATTGAARGGPRRRSVVSAGSAPPPERGTTSQRGSSSSTITKRGAFSAADEAAPSAPGDDIAPCCDANGTGT